MSDVGSHDSNVLTTLSFCSRVFSESMFTHEPSSIKLLLYFTVLCVEPLSDHCSITQSSLLTEVYADGSYHLDLCRACRTEVS